MELPGGRGVADPMDPPPPTCLPGAEAKVRALVLAPPPPTDFPQVPALPTLLTSPPPPVEKEARGDQLEPGGRLLGLGSPSGIKGRTEEVALPGASPWPPPPQKLPGRAREVALEGDEANEANEASEPEGSASGEDSDVSAQANLERHRNDMDVLLAHNSSVMRTSRHGLADAEELPVSAHELARKQRSEDAEDVDRKQPERQSLLNRLFRSGSSVTEGRRESILNQDISGLEEPWLRRWSEMLEEEGLPCTKVATNGKPYERRIHVDSRNMMVEVHQGRNGTVGISLDDLVDLCKDLESREFKKFRQRHKDPDLSRRALIMHTPVRSFSFLFQNASQRDGMGQFLVYLLTSKQRGVMAEASQSTGASDEAPAACSSPPKEGSGKVLYPNNSCYEGEFLQYMRHGHGILHLPDGTKHESEWRNDERHGAGKEHWADGTVFSGQYVRGMRHGHGTMTWPEGSRYTGMFERGRANGDGELIRTDNSIYRGQFQEDCMSGYGCMRWVDGVEYKGHFQANKRHGLGKMAWTVGKWKCYEGAWKDGVQHGRGMLTDQGGVAYVGHFVDGKLDHWEEKPQVLQPERQLASENSGKCTGEIGHAAQCMPVPRDLA
ncbi:unnamed protein product [Effrenium voratum]|uniref:Uncharacterized protein n=1 Tax=Effrenium voratum TaxID=2562239 RepID=A0AA36JE51_9DINO|nr:unnamed protein product [Effrenium voratum]